MTSPPVKEAATTPAPLSFFPRACAQEPKLARITHHHQAGWDLGSFSASGNRGLRLKGSRDVDCQLGLEGRTVPLNLVLIFKIGQI